MNIDSLLNLDTGLFACGPDGRRVPARVSEVVDEDLFVLVPDTDLDVTIGSIVKVPTARTRCCQGHRNDGREFKLCRVLPVAGP
jgi:hypothetical protein